MNYYFILITILIFISVCKILNDSTYEPYITHNYGYGSLGSNSCDRSYGPCELYGYYGYWNYGGTPRLKELFENSNPNPSSNIIEMKNINDELQKLKIIVNNLYQTDLSGNYVTHGWFVEFHNIIDHPTGIILGEGLGKIHSASNICFRAKESYPFLGSPDNPIYFPKSDNVGFRAMTVLKIPRTGYYDFRILSDDGLRFYYQMVEANVILNEKNARSPWNMIIDRWITQAENWKVSKKLYFNQNDLVLLRMDYYEMGIFASACIKIRYYLDNNKVVESDLPYENTFCSLLWADVPLLGVH